jgi:hypothetical protein
MVFVTAGLGGGTGTGAAPVVASLAIELGALTVAVVTKPFSVEGKKRMAQAENGLAELRGCVDTIITIPNSKLREVEEKITLMDAFRRADDILLQAVQGITDLITTPGIINLDFADVTTVMRGGGVALMGIGSATGEDAASKAMRAALDYKLLEENSITGAKGALINVTGGENMPLGEIEDAIGMIEGEADDNADIIWGNVIKHGMDDEIKVTGHRDRIRQCDPGKDAAASCDGSSDRSERWLVDAIPCRAGIRRRRFGCPLLLFEDKRIRNLGIGISDLGFCDPRTPNPKSEIPIPKLKYAKRSSKTGKCRHTKETSASGNAGRGFLLSQADRRTYRDGNCVAGW